MYLMNYDFLSDKSTLDPSPAFLSVINSEQLAGAIFDHMNMLNMGNVQYDDTIPEEWTTNTVLDTNFENNVNAGNVDYSTQDLAGVRVKRRIKGTFAWLTLYDITMTSSSELAFTRYDLTNQHGVTYEYAFVPYFTDNTEGTYIIKDVESSLNGVYLCSPNSIARFYGELSYGTGSVANNTGLFEPLGSKYPIVVANANTQYYSGSLSSIAMSYNQLMSDGWNRMETSSYIRTLADFITDKKVKILKDWNGNLWLVAIVDKATIGYKSEVGMGIGNVAFNFVEIGSAIDQETLMAHGFINVGFTPETNGIPAHNPIPAHNELPSSTPVNPVTLAPIPS